MSLCAQLLHRWTERACMHVARCYVSVAVLSGKIYALGGYDGDRRTNTAERYDPVLNTWTLIAEMNDHRSDACATVVDGKVSSSVLARCGGWNTRILPSLRCAGGRFLFAWCRFISLEDSLASKC